MLQEHENVQVHIPSSGGNNTAAVVGLVGTNHRTRSCTGLLHHTPSLDTARACLPCAD